MTIRMVKGDEKMNRFTAIWKLLSIGERMGAIRVAYNCYARMELVDGDVDTTIEEFEKAMDENPNDIDTVYQVMMNKVNIIHGTFHTKVVRSVDKHLGMGYNKKVGEKDLLYWAL